MCIAIKSRNLYYNYNYRGQCSRLTSLTVSKGGFETMRRRSAMAKSPRRDECHVHPEGVGFAAQDHASERAHIREVAAPGDSDVVLARDQVIGRVAMNPA